MKAVKREPWVVIPTYNERDNVKEVITRLFGLGVPNLSVLIVDDNSPDGTAEIVRSLQNTYPNLRILVRPEKSGLGQAYVAGFSHAIRGGATDIVQMDADLSHDPADVSRLLEVLEQKKADLVIGSRYIEGISVVNWPLRRLLLSIFGNLYARILTGLPIKDSTGGFRAWRAATLEEININSMTAEGYGFQVVCAYRAWKSGKNIVEVPIVFTERRVGQSKMSRRIILEASWLVLKLRLFGK